MSAATEPHKNIPQVHTLIVAFVGNPNSGKTTLFNALTGLRQKVGNYAGVTVEKKEGRLRLPDGTSAALIDLPGLYSLTPQSPDERIAREVLMGIQKETPRPDVIVNVVDASNLERNLYLTCQLLDLGVPVIVALTMTDISDGADKQLDISALYSVLGVPVCDVSNGNRDGIQSLVKTLAASSELSAPPPVWNVPSTVSQDVAALQQALQAEQQLDERMAFAEAVSLLMTAETGEADHTLKPALQTLVRQTQERLAADEIDFATLVVEARYTWIAGVKNAITPADRIPTKPKRWGAFTATERIDRIVMHPILGYVLFFLVMAVLFQSIFTWAKPLMDMVNAGIDGIKAFSVKHLAEGELRDLFTEGILGGVGSTLVFLPQILIMFFFISLLEDTGYMARAAFLMDRLMSKVGLHGKSFIPLLSSFACAIPGVMAARTIGDRKARLITILVAPLMSCSARLPVYILLIGAFIPGRSVLSLGGKTLLTLPACVMLALYFLGMAAAFGMAWLFHRTLLKGISPTFLMELPPYRLPRLRSVLFQMWERAWMFVIRAGQVILPIAVVLWALLSYPKRLDLPLEQRKQHSIGGMMGRALEPAIAPLGFDWKIGIGMVASMAAREVFVSTMGTVYNVDEPKSDAGATSLQQKMRDDVDPRTGKKVWSPLVAVSLLVYYVLAMQCMSTLAIVRRETNGWKWAMFQLGYMTLLAWVASFIIYQGGKLLGLG